MLHESAIISKVGLTFLKNRLSSVTLCQTYVSAKRVVEIAVNCLVFCKRSIFFLFIAAAGSAGRNFSSNELQFSLERRMLKSRVGKLNFTDLFQ